MTKRISVFFLLMLNIAVVMSLRGLPLIAKEGLSLIFYLLYATFIFLIPVALVSAELATGWSEGGGVYTWIKEAFGNRLGFVGIWLQWIQNVVWYPTVLAFAAGALSYLFAKPELAENKLFNVVVILGIYWGATLLNFRGIRTSGWVSSIGVIGGTIFPGLLIIVLGISWVVMGKPIAFDMSQSIIPNFSNFSSLAFLAGITLFFSGMEVSAVHANEVENPKKQYPRAIFLSAVFIFTLFVLGSFSVGAIIPADKINLTAGLMQAFKQFLTEFNLLWMLPILGFLVAFGTIGSVAAWIIGPSKGLLYTAHEGDIPPFLEKTNSKDVPVGILWVQGIIVTSITLIYLMLPTVSSAFFFLTDLTALLYLVMYVMLFAAAIRLRYKYPDVERSYKIPGGNFGMWLVAGVGFLGCLTAIFLGFFPPAQLPVGSPATYLITLIVGLTIFIGLPLVIYHFKRLSWRKNR